MTQNPPHDRLWMESCIYPDCNMPTGHAYCWEHSKTVQGRAYEWLVLLLALPLIAVVLIHRAVALVWRSEPLRRGLSVVLLPVAVLSSATACLLIAPVMLADLLLWMRGSGGIDSSEKVVYATAVVIASPLVLGRYAVYGVDS